MYQEMVIAERLGDCRNGELKGSASKKVTAIDRKNKVSCCGLAFLEELEEKDWDLGKLERSMVTKDLLLRRYYLQQFGMGVSKGRKYLKRIFWEYLEDGQRADFRRYLTKVSRENRIKVQSVKQLISSYLCRSYSCSTWGWVHLGGWRGDGPPTFSAAIRIICGGYPAFLRTYGKDVAKRIYGLLPSPSYHLEKDVVGKDGGPQERQA